MRAYFNGCSTGGRQALAEAQRYPDDYDGIIAGAAANYPIAPAGRAGLDYRDVRTKSDRLHPASQVSARFTTPCSQACDALDGVKDRVLEDPRRCHFDPQVHRVQGRRRRPPA